MLTHWISPDFCDGVHIYRQPPSGQSPVHQVAQLRTDVVHCQYSAGAVPVVKVVPVTGAAFLGFAMDQIICASFSHTHYWYRVDMYDTGRVLSLLAIKFVEEKRGKMGRSFMTTGRMATLQLVGLVT